MKRVTIKDIAKHLAISASTVSRALANDPNIRKETRDRIVRTADQLGYKRNIVAANLRTGRTGTIGAVVDEMMTPYIAQALRGIQNVMQLEGISIMVACSYHDSAQEAKNIHAMESALVDGLIIAPCHGSANNDIFQHTADKGVPIVFLGRNPGIENASEVVPDDYSKAFYLMDHVLRGGRKRVAHITGDVPSAYFDRIVRGYRDCLARFGLDFDPKLVVRAKPTFEGGISAVDELALRGVEFDAVFAASDLQAIGAMNHLLEKGVDVPGDVAVAGYAGSYLSKMVFPQLTTVEHPQLEMGEKAGRLLLELIKNPDAPSRSVTVDAKIMLRNSTHSQVHR